MDEPLLAMLDDCLDRIILHGDSVESCLERYPERAADLEPLLKAGTRAREIRSVDARPESKQAARGRLLSAVALKREADSKGRVGSLGWHHRWAVALITILALVVMGAGTVGASSSSLPGDLLYPVKTAAEKVQVLFTFGDEAKANLYAKLAERRANEIGALSEDNRAVPVSALNGMNVHTERALGLAKKSSRPATELVNRLVELTDSQKELLAALIAKPSTESKAGLKKALALSQSAHRQAVGLRQGSPGSGGNPRWDTEQGAQGDASPASGEEAEGAMQDVPRTPVQAGQPAGGPQGGQSEQKPGSPPQAGGSGDDQGLSGDQNLEGEAAGNDTGGLPVPGMNGAGNGAKTPGGNSGGQPSNTPGKPAGDTAEGWEASSSYSR
jgi:hypothetical protein